MYSLQDQQRLRQRQRRRVGQTITYWGLALFVIIALYAAWVCCLSHATQTTRAVPEVTAADF